MGLPNGWPALSVQRGRLLHADAITVDQDEVDRLWEQLSAVVQAEQCGWLKDRFGVSWQIIPTALPRAVG